MPAWLNITNVSIVLASAYAILSAIATAATAFAPGSKAAHVLAAVVLDVAKLRELLGGLDPSKAGKVAGGVVLVLSLGATQIGCPQAVAPIIDGVTCFVGKLPEIEAVPAGTARDVLIAKDAIGCGLDAAYAAQLVKQHEASVKAMAALPAPSASAR
jgi:hypothetical protein